MTDDIVRRLRDVDHPVSADFRIEAAAEIERLRSNVGCARNQRSTQFCHEALDAQRDVETLKAELVRNADECRETLAELRHRVETLRAERNEARREVCARFALIYDMTVQDVEKLRGWDCFKEHADSA
jgi:uncharacterized coiled-coil DUF342 family protein